MNVFALFKAIKVFIFDIDGVLTNGQLLVSENGTLLRSMNVKDGYALQLAVKKGYEIVAISGGNSDSAKLRLEKLGLKKVFINVSDKVALFKELMFQNSWSKEQILFMGDDIPDKECLQTCGLPTCPADAVSEIQSLCSYISPIGGGCGCVRDVIEKVLKLRGDWPTTDNW